MENENIVITIKGKSSQDGKDTDVTNVSSQGVLEYLPGGLKIIYDDSTSVGVKGVTATLTANKNGVITIERKGVLEHKLIVEKGKRHNCIYTTPYGNMNVGVFGVDVNNELNLSGGKLKMKYTLDINSGLISNNEIEISIKAAK